MAACGFAVWGDAVHIPNIPHYVSLAASAVVFAAAVWRGGPHERLMASLQLWSCICARWWVWMPLSVGLPYDLVALTVCLACTLRSRSYWTVWASASLLLAVTSGFITLLNPHLTRWAYLSAARVFDYALDTAILCGALSRRRTARGPRGPRKAPMPFLPSFGGTLGLIPQLLAFNTTGANARAGAHPTRSSGR